MREGVDTGSGRWVVGKRVLFRERMGMLALGSVLLHEQGC